MPLAFDLISTLVMGSIFPVATTLFARSPFSTLASFEGSILVPPLDAISAPATIRTTPAAAIKLQIMIRLRRFSNANVETGLAPSHSAALHALRPPDNEKESERLGCTEGQPPPAVQAER